MYGRKAITSISSIHTDLTGLKARCPQASSLVTSLLSSYSRNRSQFNNHIHQISHECAPTTFTKESFLKDVFQRQQVDSGVREEARVCSIGRINLLRGLFKDKFRINILPRPTSLRNGISPTFWNIFARQKKPFLTNCPKYLNPPTSKSTSLRPRLGHSTSSQNVRNSRMYPMPQSIFFNAVGSNPQ